MDLDENASDTFIIQETQPLTADPSNTLNTLTGAAPNTHTVDPVDTLNEINIENQINQLSSEEELAGLVLRKSAGKKQVGDVMVDGKEEKVMTRR